VKVGDLVRFRNSIATPGPLGVVISIGSTDEVFENRTADVLWGYGGDKPVSYGDYRFALLEVISARR
jgi:hypothetical protein